MKKIAVLKSLLKVANELDGIGMTKDASKIDTIMIKVAEKDPLGPGNEMEGTDTIKTDTENEMEGTEGESHDNLLLRGIPTSQVPVPVADNRSWLDKAKYVAKGVVSPFTIGKSESNIKEQERLTNEMKGLRAQKALLKDQALWDNAKQLEWDRVISSVYPNESYIDGLKRRVQRLHDVVNRPD